VKHHPLGIILLSMAMAAPPCAAAPAQDRTAQPSGKGVNYLTGEGMDQLNCDAGNTHQVKLDRQQMRAIGVEWMRIETAQTAISGMPVPPTCPKPEHEFDRIITLAKAARAIGAHPLVNILAWHYPPSIRSSYAAWLNRLLDAIGDIPAFEIGNEENLDYRTEGGGGVHPNNEPYGWDFHAGDFDANDFRGICPTDPAKLANLKAGVETYVAWLNDTSAIIRSRRPGALIVLGGLSSYQPDCWLKWLGQEKAYRAIDAIAYHPYPRYAYTPQSAASTLRDVQRAVSHWPTEPPIWVTEFGFTTNANDGAQVPSEDVKAKYLTREFDLLRQQIAGPIIWWTARDYPLTAAQWRQDCAMNACPGSVGGYGLFDWRAHVLFVEPAGTAFGRLPGTADVTRTP
jgi:hypothetical protein